TWGGVDSGATEVLVGRVYAEHVFTRPFAPPGQRRVTALPSGVPADGGPLRTFDAVGAPDRSGGDGGPDLLPDVPIAFGVHHTDSNLHVNSLVYPRLFEDAAVALRPDRPLARFCEVAWRKPCFAGDRVTLRRWALDEGTGGAFVDPDGSVRCRIALR
ncbi:MAG: hypothetical protein ABMB14_38285, partial [Myxococcota bacterium]